MSVDRARLALLALVVAVVTIALAPVRSDGADTGARVATGGIQGVVVDGAGNPVFEAWVGIGPLDGSYTNYHLTDRNGRYRVAVQPGTYSVDVLPPDTETARVFVVESGIDGYAVRSGQLVTVDEQLLSGGPVTGRVVDGDGRPVAGASVGALPLQPSTRPPYAGYLDDLRTDDDGRYTIPHVPPGDYRLFAGREGFSDSYWPEGANEFEASVFRVADDTGEQLTDTVLRVPGTITGRAILSNPGGDARVTLSRRDPQGRLHPLLVYPDGVVAQDGTFEFNDIPAGRYWLSVGSYWYWRDAPDVASSEPIDLAPGQRIDLAPFEVRPLTIRGTVVNGRGQPVFGADAYVERLEGARWVPHASQPRTDADGEYEFSTWTAGRYRVSFYDEARYRNTDPVEVELTFNGPPARADARLHDRGAVAGTVTWPDGLPAAGVVVVPFVRSKGVWVPLSRNGPYSSGLTTDDSGGYRFPLPENAYRIGVAYAAKLDTVVYVGGTTSLQTARDLPVVAETTTRGDVVLPRPGRISGTVTDESGKPLSGVTVSAQQWPLALDTPRAVTDSFGDYVIENVHPGTFRVVAEDRERLSEVYPNAPLQLAGLAGGAPVSVASGVTRTRTDFVLTHGSTLRASFVSRTADQVRDADLQLYWRFQDRWVPVSRGRTVQQTRLPSGQYRLAYRVGLSSGAQVAAGHGPATAQPRPDGQTVVLDGVHTTSVRTFVDPRGVVSGSIRRWVPGTRVAIDRRTGRRWRALTVLRAHQVGNGAVYATPRLAPGHYRIRFSGPLRFPATVVADVSRTRHVRRNVLMPGLTWSGRIGPSRVGTVISAVTPDGSVAAQTRVAEVYGQNDFVVGPLAAGGRYTLGVHDPTGQYEDFYLGPTSFTGTGRYFDAIWAIGLEDAQFLTVSKDVPWAEFYGPNQPGPVLHGRLLRPDGTAWAGRDVEVLAIRAGVAEAVQTTTTTGRGFWRFSGLAPGSYRLRYDVADASGDGVLQVDGGCRPADGRAVAVRATDGLVDAGTVRLASVSARVRPVALPVVTGTAAVGRTLVASRGRWTPCDNTVGFQWLRDGRPITGATGPAYAVQAADRGHRLSARTVVGGGVDLRTFEPRSVAYVTDESVPVG